MSNMNICKTAFAGLVLLIGFQANAGLFDDEEARKAILDLRQRIETEKAEFDQKLSDEQKRASEENAQLRRSMLELQSQNETSRAEIATLRGQNEQLGKDLADTQRRLKDISQALDQRMSKLEPVNVTNDGASFLAEPSEKRDYEFAFESIRQQDLASAEVLFGNFLSTWPQSGYRGSALFWLGNAQYVNRNYKDAINNFRKMVTLYPQHPRAADAMLAISNCQLEMKDSKAARKTLEDLIAAYPKTEAADTAKDRLTRIK